MLSSTVRGCLAVAAALGLVSAATGSAEAAARPIRVVDLGTLGGAQSSASEINRRGQVAGYSETADGATHAFVWYRGRMTDLGTLGGRNSWASDISDTGYVTGASDTADGSRHAFLWRDGVMTDLGTLGGRFSNGIFVDDHGQVVGQTTMPGGSSPYFVWRDGTMRLLGSLGGPHGVDAAALSGRGQIVGSGGVASGETRAFSWFRGRLTELPPLAGADHSDAADVNARGQVAGSSSGVPGGVLREPVVWDRGRALGLGTLGGDTAAAVAINDRGSVIGFSSTADGSNHSFLWRRGVMTDLGGAATPLEERRAVDLNNRDDVLFEITAGPFEPSRNSLWRKGAETPLPALVAGGYVDAREINDCGQIAGSAAAADGRRHAALWTS
jgi:probable HAF family extracellular repeat protein